MERRPSAGILIFLSCLTIIVTIAALLLTRNKISGYAGAPQQTEQPPANIIEYDKPTIYKPNLIEYEGPTIYNEISTYEYEKDVSDAVNLLADAVSSNNDDANSICALFDEKEQSEVRYRISAFTDMFNDKNEPIDEIYVNKGSYSVCVYTDKTGGAVDHIGYEGVICTFTTRSNIYTFVIDFSADANYNIVFDSIHAFANCSNEYCKDAESGSYAFDFTNAKDEGYDGERRLINGQNHHWNSASTKIESDELNVDEWERKKKADEFVDVYGEPGTPYDADNGYWYMIYASDTDTYSGEPTYLCVKINKNGFIREIQTLTAAGDLMYKIK